MISFLEIQEMNRKRTMSIKSPEESAKTSVIIFNGTTTVLVSGESGKRDKKVLAGFKRIRREGVI